jgi:hypothetical protein
VLTILSLGDVFAVDDGVAGRNDKGKLTSVVVEGVFKVEKLILSDRAKSDEIVGFKFLSEKPKDFTKDLTSDGKSAPLSVSPSFIFFTTRHEADTHLSNLKTLKLRAVLVETKEKILEAEQILLFKNSVSFGAVPITLFSRNVQLGNAQVGSAGSMLDMHLPSSDYVIF